jgi:phage shock protein C
MIAGVCGGIAEYFDIDPTLVRIIAVVLVVLGVGMPVVLYIIAMILMPPDPAGQRGYVNASAAQTTTSDTYQTSQTAQTTTSNTHQNAGFGQDTAATTSQSADANVAQAAASNVAQAAAPGAAQTATSGAYKTTTDPTPPGPAERVGTAVRHHWPVAVIVGALLIGIGILALLTNFISISLWRFWPVIIIVAGLVTLFTPSSKGWSLERAGGGIVLITIGLALLAWMLRIVSSMGFVHAFLNLWPMLLVVCGLSIIGSALKNSAAKLASSLLLSITVVMGLWLYGGIVEQFIISTPDGHDITIELPSSPTLPAYSQDTPLLSELEMAGSKTGSFSLEGGGASVAVLPTDADKLELAGYIAPPSSADLSFTDAAQASARLDLANITSPSPAVVSLPTSVEWRSLDFNAGASYLLLDLDELTVHALNVKTGASACEIVLGQPAEGGSELNIDSGFTAIKLRVPKTSACLINVTGLNTVVCDDQSFTYIGSLGAWHSRYGTVHTSTESTAESALRSLSEENVYVGSSRESSEGIPSAYAWTINITGVAALDFGVSS